MSDPYCRIYVSIVHDAKRWDTGYRRIWVVHPVIARAIVRCLRWCGGKYR